LDDPLKSDTLSEKRQVTLVLRLLLDGENNLLRGDLVDVTGQSLGHFTDWISLAAALEEWQSRPKQTGG
jgi:hypothetical protein